jgi:hypothetical protein
MDPMMWTVGAVSARLLAAVTRQVSAEWKRLGERERRACTAAFEDAARLVVARVRHGGGPGWQGEYQHVLAQVMSVTAVVGAAVADSLEAAVQAEIKRGASGK